jgi:uncharacterized protein (TIGR00297 family)
MNIANAAFAFASGGIFLYFLLKKLTPTGVAAALLMAVSIYAGLRLAGLLLICSFFLLGVAATSYGRKKKEALGYAEQNKGKRKAGQVLANGGVPMLIALMAWWLPQEQEQLMLLFAATLSSATADTLSSELGMVWGNQTFNILSWRRDKKGENGVVSLEGLAAGIGGSMLIALVYAVATGTTSPFRVFIIVIAGTVGNLADSVLGATLERKGWLGNNAVNLCNTFVAALAAFLLALLFE